MRPNGAPFARFWALALFLALVLHATPVFAASPSPAIGRNGMVATSQADATRAGVAMLEAGGNAVDAAVASAFAQCVTEPFSTGIGGGGFILIRRPDGEVVAIDARETAPAAAERDMYVREGVAADASLYGPLAVATPGLVAGLALAVERYGTKSLAEVLGPAIALAEQGYAINPHQVRMIEIMRGYSLHERFPETTAIQFPPEGQTEPGWVLRQRDLARTLRRIAREGPEVFYEGEIAQAIAAEMQARGGLITLEDLASYEPVLREPVRGSYRGHEVASFPPPSSGGVALVAALNILEGLDLAHYGHGSSSAIHRIAESLKLAFVDRAVFMGDPDFVEIPVEHLTSKSYGEEQRRRINPGRWRRAPWTWGKSEVAIQVKAPGLPVDDHGTTHLSVSDSKGGAVAITHTINILYGSGITVRGTGIILNNEMDDFAMAENQPNVFGLIHTRDTNAIAPRKRPLSSMTPTILTKDGDLFMVTGSPGGPRIISTTLLTILNVVDFGLDPQAAVSAPRFHHQWIPDELKLEPEFSEDVAENLRARGHEVVHSKRHWSSAQVIVFDPETGWHEGGTDPRRNGLALGP